MVVSVLLCAEVTLFLFTIMTSVNTDYTDIHKSKETNCWNNSGGRQQSYKEGRKTRSWVYPTDSNGTNSTPTKCRSGHGKGRSSSGNTNDVTPQYVGWKNYRLLKRNVTEVSSNGENSEDNNGLKIVANNCQGADSSGEPLKTGKVVTVNNNNALSSHQSVHDSSDDTNHTLTTMEKDNNVDFESHLEEKRRLRKERQKVKKEIKKQEKAILREEEMRKKRLAPKDQKVTIIDHSVLDRFSQIFMKSTTPTNVDAKGSTYNGSEFPALGEITTTSRSLCSHYQKKNENKGEGTNIEIVSSSESPSKGETSSPQSVDRDQNISSSVSSPREASIVFNNKFQEKQGNEAKWTDSSKKIIPIVDDKAAGKRPRRRDPIQLDIHEILKVQEIKHEVSVKQHASKTAQKAEVVRYAGNILDSDNPERKRGKQREVPKAKKPSNLKQIILQERAKRKEPHLNEALITMNDINSKEEKLPNDKGISNSDDAILKNIMTDNAHTESKLLDDIESGPSCTDTHSTNYSKCKDFVKDEHINLPLETSPVTEENTDNGQRINENLTSRENQIYEVKHNKGSNEDKGRNPVCQLSCQTVSTTIISENKASVSKIHSRKFRDYCDHFVTPDISNATTALLEDIVKFHDRQFARSPLKASAKRRHITGLKEVRRFLALRRVRLLVIAPDLEQTSSSGGLDDLVGQLKAAAIANEVPYVFALSRRHLGYILKKKVPVSCVGVLNYDGTEQNFRSLMTAVEEAREKYQLQVAQLLVSISAPSAEVNQTEEATNDDNDDDVNKEVVASLLAKLVPPQSTDSPSPFLQVIERCTNLDSDCGTEEGCSEE